MGCGHSKRSDAKNPQLHSPCCPVGSEPKLASDYKPKGTIVKHGDLDLYTIGQGDKAIIFIYDVFGVDAGRTKLMCDQFADAGYSVILPDFFRGDAWASEDFSNFGAWVVKYDWEKLREDFEKHIYPFIEEKKFKTVGMVGCCWGDYVVFHACASGKITSAVGFHPTLDKFATPLEELTEAVKCPQFLLPAGNDPESIKEGGVVEKILKGKPFGDKVKIKTYAEMTHGWMPRGDISKPEVARDYKEGMTLAIEYFKQTL